MAETIDEIKDKIHNTVGRIGQEYAKEGHTSIETENLLAAQLARLVHRAQIEERKKR